MKWILCVGDSLTFGSRDEFHSSFPAQLSRLFYENKGESVYCINQGLPGETSGELLRRIYPCGLSYPTAKVALLTIGSNDTFLPQKLDIYADNIRQCVSVLHEGGRRVGLGLLPPILGPGLPNYPKNAQTLVDQYNEVLLQASKSHECFVADFRKLGSYIIDTVHFGHEGYSQMAQIWYNAIEENQIPI